MSEQTNLHADHPVGTFWVFAYGSLIWDPPFTPVEAQKALLAGYARHFCMDSVIFRGTHSDPGLVLALRRSPGSVCHGMALRTPSGEPDEVLRTLRDREFGYVERYVPVQLDGKTTIQCLTHVIEPASPYFRDLSKMEQARIIARSCGTRGPNRDYLFSLLQALDRNGIHDPQLHALGEAVRAALSIEEGDT